jgi:hypothetical protein
MGMNWGKKVFLFRGNAGVCEAPGDPFSAE